MTRDEVKELIDMKKKYIKPCTEVVKVEITKILCGSCGGSFDPDAMP